MTVVERFEVCYVQELILVDVIQEKFCAKAERLLDEE